MGEGSPDVDALEIMLSLCYFPFSGRIILGTILGECIVRMRVGDMYITCNKGHAFALGITYMLTGVPSSKRVHPRNLTFYARCFAYYQINQGQREYEAFIPA